MMRLHTNVYIRRKENLVAHPVPVVRFRAPRRQ